MSNKNSDKNAIEKIIHLMQTDDSVNAPADAVKWSKNIFRTRVAEPKNSAVKKVLAVLQIDWSESKTAFGERFSGKNDLKQMFIQAGEYAVDLRMSKIANGWKLYGQIIGDVPLKSILRFEGKDVSFETEIDKFAEFSCETESLENYNLLILPPE